MGERVGVDDRSGRRRRARPPARRDVGRRLPEPTTQACTWPVADDPRGGGDAPGRRRAGRRTAPCRTSPLAAPATESTPAPGYGREPGADADHAAGVLVRVRRRAAAAGPPRRRAGAPRPPPAGSRDRCRRGARRRVRRRRVDQERDLVGAEGDRDVGAARAGPRARRCRRRPRSARRPRRPARPRAPRSAALGVGREPGAPADPDDAVDDEVRRGRAGRSLVTRPPARLQRREPALVRLVGEQPRLDPARRGGRAPRRRTARRRRCRRLRPAAAPGARTPCPSRSSTAYASPAAARCISAPSGSRAISAASAARTCSTVCALLMPTSR